MKDTLKATLEANITAAEQAMIRIQGQIQGWQAVLAEIDRLEAVEEREAENGDSEGDAAAE